MKNLMLLFGVMLIFTFINQGDNHAQQPKVNLESERKELLRLHELGRKAHLEKNAEMLVSGFSDDFRSISNGKISQPKREDSKKRFQSYLDSVEFVAWDDISAPVIKISQDGTMAHVHVHKKVQLKAKDEQGKNIEELTIFAWTSTYEKRDGKWQLTSVTSTNEPSKLL